MADLLDVNVWVALHFPASEAYSRATRYWREEASEEVVLCEITAHGFLRLVTNAHAAAGAPLSIPDAWQAYKNLCARPNVSYVSGNSSLVDEVIEEWIRQGVFAPRHWTDAHLAALARAFDYRLVTFDRGVTRYPDLNVYLLVADSADTADST